MTDIYDLIKAARLSDKRTTAGYREHLLCDEIQRLLGIELSARDYLSGFVTEA